MKHFDDQISVGRGWGKITYEKNYDYLDGEVATEHGFVAVYSQGSDIYNYHTRLDFIWRGRLYMRTFKKRYTSRGLVTKAKQFAEEIRSRHEQG